MWFHGAVAGQRHRSDAPPSQADKPSRSCFLRLANAPASRSQPTSAATTSSGRYLPAPPAQHDAERSVRQRSLQCLRLRPWCCQPCLPLSRIGQDHRHRLWMQLADLGVRRGGREGVNVDGHPALLTVADTCPRRREPAKATSARLRGGRTRPARSSPRFGGTALVRVRMRIARLGDQCWGDLLYVLLLRSGE